MNILRFSGLAVLSAAALVNACVGDDPAPVTETPEADAATPPGADAATPTDSATNADTSDGASCGDTTMSADNCGTCGHSCGGGTCTASVCQPVIVASNINQPLGVAVAATSAIWYRNGAVERCDVTGCTGAPTLITDQVNAGSGQPGGNTIMTDGAKVAWIANGDIFACNVTGCINGALPAHSSGLTGIPTQLAIDGSNLFSTQDLGAERIGPISTLVMAGVGMLSDIPTGIAADPQHVYVAGNGLGSNGVDVCTRVGGGACAGTTGSVTRIFQDAKYISAGGGVLMATSSEGIKVCPSSGCGGAATIVQADDKTAAAIATSNTHAAWVNTGTAAGDGTVRACTLPTCKTVRTVATGQAQPVAVTIADGFVYWANKGTGATNGSIWRAAL